MNADAMAALRAAIETDPQLQSRFAAATTEAEVVSLAEELGIAIVSEDLSGPDELSETELETVSGGYTFPQTDWIYCDNPWTNAWCTLKC